MNKKVIFILTIISISLFSFAGCNKNNATLYEGIFGKGILADGCPNEVRITKTIPNGLPVNTILAVSFVDDSIKVNQLQGGGKITFKIIKYSPDTTGYLAICIWPTYDATIELAN